MNRTKVSKNFIKMSKVYRIFANYWENILDFSDDSLLQMYKYETFGEHIGDCNRNGFYVGKQWMDVNIKMWREDIQTGILTKHELYSDGSFPEWWLKKVLP